MTEFDLVALWTGRTILIAIIVFTVWCIVSFLYIYFFMTPYCPICHSRKREILYGNLAGGHRCAKCNTYYWYKKRSGWLRWLGKGKSSLERLAE